MKRFGDRIPCYTVNGEYQFVEDGGWSGGFWPGILWRLYQKTGEKMFMGTARLAQKRLYRRVTESPETLDQDTGYNYSLSFAADYKLTGDQTARLITIKAADVLRARYNKKGGFIKAWEQKPEDSSLEVPVNRELVVMDGSMMNIQIMFWAAEHALDRELKEMAENHADTVLKYMIRDDYTTYNVYTFEKDTGQPVCGKNFQGIHDESCWSRGQAYNLYGFALAYKNTGRIDFLNAAVGLAKCFISKLDEDFVPYWDFACAECNDREKDSSASAVAAGGLLELGRLVHDSKMAEYFKKKAESILKSLYLNYSAKGDPSQEGILVHGCGYKKGGITDRSLIYGDYFYVEAVTALMGLDDLFWLP